MEHAPDNFGSQRNISRGTKTNTHEGKPCTCGGWRHPAVKDKTHAARMAESRQTVGYADRDGTSLAIAASAFRRRRHQQLHVNCTQWLITHRQKAGSAVIWKQQKTRVYSHRCLSMSPSNCFLPRSVPPSLPPLLHPAVDTNKTRFLPHHNSLLISP